MQAEAAAGARSQPGARQERTTSTASQGRSGAIVGGKNLKEMGRAQQAEAVGASEAKGKKRAKSSASQDPNKAHHVQCDPGSKKRAKFSESPVKDEGASQPGARGKERATSSASQGRSWVVGGKQEMGCALQAEAVGASEARGKERATHHVQCKPGSKKRANCCASPVKEDEMLDPKCTFERHDVAAAYAKAPEA